MNKVVRKKRTAKDILGNLVTEEFASPILDNLSDNHIADWRQKSFAEAKRIPTPTKKWEDFKYVSFSKMELDNLTPAKTISHCNTNEILTGSDNSDLIPDQFKVEDNKTTNSGDFIFASIEDTLQQKPEILSKYLKLWQGEFEQRRFALLANTFLSNGVVLHVNENNELNSPLHSYHRITGQKTLTALSHLIVLEAHAGATLIVDIDSDKDASGLCNSTINIRTKAGSKFRLLLNQQFSESLNSVMTINAYLEDDSELEIVTINAGCNIGQLEIDCNFAGRGSRATINGIYIGKKTEEYNILTHQNHQSGDSSSDSYFAGTLSNLSKTNYLGKITIAPNAQHCDAYQTNRNLMLTKGAKVNTSPKLEISSNDVRCSHGATTSKVSEEEMFYLQSRGIERDTARILFAEGFLEQVRKRITNDILQSAFEKRLTALLTDWS